MKKMLNSENLSYKILGFVLGTFVFIPNKIKPYLVVLVVLYSIFSKRNKKTYIDFLKKVLPIALLFFLYAFSLFNTSDFNIGLTLVGRMSPLIVLPTSFFFISEDKLSFVFDYFKKSFIISLSFYSICIFFYLEYLGCFSGDSSFEYAYSFITYSFYGINDHPIYISTYLSVGMLMLLYSPFKSKILSALTFLIIFSGLIVLTRKGSIIIFSICTLIYFISNRRNLIKATLFFLILAVVFFSFSEVRYRFSEIFTKSKIDKNPETSSGIRIIVWENALHLTFKNNLLGYGAGDVQMILNDSYIKKGYKKIADNNYNAHNQYLQTGLTVGVLGLLLFVGGLCFLYYNFYLKSDKRAMTILLFFILILLTESYLERQNGAIFFSLIIGMHTFVNNEK